MLLADLRVNINKPENDRCTPLYIASQNGHLGIVQHILASGREVDTQTKSRPGTSPWQNKTAAEIAHRQGTRAKFPKESEEDYLRKHHHGLIISALIDSFDADPVTTRQRLRELPELRDPFISDLFALVVFLCDGLLTVEAGDSASSSSSLPADTTKKGARFFQIARCLPTELQMVMCNRVFGSMKDAVLTKHSEPAFKKLGRLLASSE